MLIRGRVGRVHSFTNMGCYRWLPDTITTATHPPIYFFYISRWFTWMTCFKVKMANFAERWQVCTPDVSKQIAYQQRAPRAWCCFTLQRDSMTFKFISFHMLTQSKDLHLNLYFDIAMCNKSHIEKCWYITLCWHRFINDLRYKSSEIMHTVSRDDR